MLGDLPVFPGILTTLRDFKRLAEQGDRVLLALFCNELKFHNWLSEKMTRAFFNIARSWRKISFSRRK
jgi:succinate dehydrogenase flavin-adding protein (antitoxin of CptAB toxin-antitoxin module)